MSDEERGTADGERGTANGESVRWGPWALTLGVAAVGAVALARELLRGGEDDQTA